MTKNSKQYIRLLKIMAVAASSTLLFGCSAGADTAAEEVANGVKDDCVPVNEFPTIVDGVLTVAGMNLTPKFSAESPEGPYGGFDYTLINEFAAENCLTVDYNPGTPPATILEVQEGKADMVGGQVTYNEQRAATFNM